METNSIPVVVSLNSDLTRVTHPSPIEECKPPVIKKIGVYNVNKFILNSAADFHLRISSISPPQFTSEFSGLDKKKIKFPATYNIFMKQFVSLLSIISIFPVPEDQLDPEASQSMGCSNEFWVECEKVVEIARLIAVYRKAKNKERNVKDMVETERKQYEIGKSKYGTVSENIEFICGNLVGAAVHKNEALKEMAKEYLSGEYDVKWIHKFLKESQKKRAVGVFTDSDNYSSTFLWERFAHQLDYVVVEYND